MKDQGGGMLDQEDAERILKDRARALAQPLVGEEEHGFDVVVLTVGAERYGVALTDVIETLPLESLAPVPGLPAFWAGIVNVRGTIHPVLDLAEYLGLSAQEGPAGSGMLVLVRGAGLTAGLNVAAADSIARIKEEDLRPPFAGGAGGDGAVSCVTRTGITMLDVHALLGDPRLTIREETS